MPIAYSNTKPKNHNIEGKDMSLSLTSNIEKSKVEKINANGCVSKGVLNNEIYGKRTKSKSTFAITVIFNINLRPLSSIFGIGGTLTI